jgi:hypothetical protein
LLQILFNIRFRNAFFAHSNNTRLHNSNLFIRTMRIKHVDCILFYLFIKLNYYFVSCCLCSQKLTDSTNWPAMAHFCTPRNLTVITNLREIPVTEHRLCIVMDTCLLRCVLLSSCSGDSCMCDCSDKAKVLIQNTAVDGIC